MTRYWISGCIVFLASVLAFGGWYYIRKSGEPAFALNNDEVEGIRAEIFKTELFQFGVPPTEIPAEYIPKVLDALRPIGRLRYTQSFDDLRLLGKMTISKRDKTKIEVTFPWWGQNPLAYKCDGNYCIRTGRYQPMYDMVDEDGRRLGYGDESQWLATAIQEIHREVVAGKKSEQVEEAFAMLERSQGKRPPK